MITREVRDLWATALEGGAYKQGRGALLTFDDKYCCLGVLCAELDLPTSVIHATNHGDDSGYDAIDKIGLALEDRQMFIEANDGCRKSFAEIAEMVRALPTSD